MIQAYMCSRLLIIHMNSQSSFGMGLRLINYTWLIWLYLNCFEMKWNKTQKKKHAQEISTLWAVLIGCCNCMIFWLYSFSEMISFCLFFFSCCCCCSHRWFFRKQNLIVEQLCLRLHHCQQWMMWGSWMADQNSCDKTRKLLHIRIRVFTINVYVVRGIKLYTYLRLGRSLFWYVYIQCTHKTLYFY